MLETRTLVTGSPLLGRSIVALDCEVLRHVDLEADFEIYVGQVLSAFVGTPVGGGGGVTMTIPGRAATGSAD
jgi:flavin reductase (DIM6/NTAB) family NADH-FMN oxidoreductase RutF